MPSAALLHGAINRPLNLTSYQTLPSRSTEVLISVFSFSAAGEGAAALAVANPSSISYVGTNLAVGFMFSLAESFTVQKAWWANGTTVGTNNADVAVYTEDGLTRIVAAGSTLIAGANVLQEVDVTDTVLPGGARYWCVYNQNGVTATPCGISATSIPTWGILGCAQFAGAVPLGTTFTPAQIGQTNFPFFGIAGRTQVA